MLNQLKILEKQIRQGTTSHAYLFYGSDEKAKDAAVEKLMKYLLGPEFLKSSDFSVMENAPITVEDIRTLKKRASESPLSAAHHVFLIKNLESISKEGSNALLKLLEEPPGSSVIIATTSALESILKTLRSRFAVLGFFSESQKESSGIVQDILEAENKMLKNPGMAAALRLSRFFTAEEGLRIPAINKRLVGEYLTMIDHD